MSYFKFIIFKIFINFIGFDYSTIELRKQTLNKHLKIYIEGIVNNRHSKILEKTFI